MARRSERPMTASEPEAVEGNAAPVFVVAPGRTVHLDRAYAPGEELPLDDAEEVERLARLGFIVEAEG